MTEYTRVSSIEQDLGLHAPGLRERLCVEVTTDLSDRADSDWEDLDEDAREWWNDVLDSIHEAEVRVAELPAEMRRRVEQEISHTDLSDLETSAALLHRIVDAVEDAMLLEPLRRGDRAALDALSLDEIAALAESPDASLRVAAIRAMGLRGSTP